MIRRPTTLIAALAAAAVLTGCGTFDDDVAASVNGVELTTDEFTERYERRYDLAVRTQYDQLAQQSGVAAADEFLASVDEDFVDGELARGVVADFLHRELLREVGMLDLYAEGPDASGVACLDLGQVADLGVAEDAVARLDAGESWSAFEDEALAVSTGCAPMNAIGDLAIQLAGISDADPYRTLLFETGLTAVVRLQSADEVDPLQLVNLVSTEDPSFVEPLTQATADAEITVDPQFGTYDRDVVWFLGGPSPVTPLG